MSGETEGQPSGWTTDTALYHVQRQLIDLRAMLDERYATQTKALDAAFAAQEKAVQAALTSAEKAVTKAEVASEKRFKAVNEFRQTLSDQATTFISRAESEAHRAVLSDRLTHLEDRVNTEAGNDTGRIQAEVARRASTQQAVAIVGAVIAVVTVAVILILGLNN